MLNQEHRWKDQPLPGIEMHFPHRENERKEGG